MDEVVQPAYGTVPLLLIALGAVLLILALIIWARLHAFVTLVLVSLLVAVVAKVPPGEIVDTLLGGFGTTLAGVALLVGLGAMIGRMLEITGGAQVLADTLINRFGERRAPMALGVAALLFGIPIFFDAGLIVFLPIIFSVARRFGGSVLLYALPAAGAFAVMHAFVPPHPGPVAAAEVINADMGLLVLMGLIIAIPTWYIGSYLFSRLAGRRIDIPLPAEVTLAEGDTEHRLPRFGTVLFILLLPPVLIFFNTGLDALAGAGAINGDQAWVQVIQMIGSTPVALLITVLVALPVLGRGRRSAAGIEEIVNDALKPVAPIILITGAGGMFGGVLRASGIGEAIAGTMRDTGLPVIVAAFVIAVIIRVAQGSATVALTTTAGLIAPTVAATPALTGVDLVLIVIAIAGGSTVLSHVNDSGFWLVGRYLGMDVKTTLKTWTVMETLLGTIGFVIAFLLSLVL